VKESKKAEKSYSVRIGKSMVYKIGFELIELNHSQTVRHGSGTAHTDTSGTRSRILGEFADQEQTEIVICQTSA